ncbi:amino acid ABC transporter substrate-binding protein [Alteromonas oceanisediminis]|uniref:amino acid ABC transporter substrate-binding protein n=1 Tax=Alteromonas oceanisediminis TaxID=2836180 RepID=UPI001BDB28C9|nr:amino acid ABC transporter substrate-binding protein [Alteromonas oceanisediminis]MBT0584797.1 amino acid ABC transporter substrate-binding protein [Alteromonas oceanisediminis]
MMRILALTVLLCVGGFSSFITQAAVWQITYPRAMVEGDVRNDYPVALLNLALNKTGVRYELKPSDRIMLQGKALRQLRENRSVNIVWSMTDQQRETELLPIRIPITKGLIGWRVFLIHRDNQTSFSRIASLATLQGYVPVQGEDWPDTKILQSNGFDVETASTYLETFEILSRFQADFYPRSVIEVLSELEIDNINPDIVLEKRLALHYPSAMYFFINRANPTLAKLIETGLQRAIEDGSFDELFKANYQPLLEKLNLAERIAFELENPLMSQETPLNNSQYWYTLPPRK